LKITSNALVALVGAEQDCFKELFEAVDITRRISEFIWLQRVPDRRSSDRKSPTTVCVESTPRHNEPSIQVQLQPYVIQTQPYKPYKYSYSYTSHIDPAIQAIQVQLCSHTSHTDSVDHADDLCLEPYKPYKYSHRHTSHADPAIQVQPQTCKPYRPSHTNHTSTATAIQTI